MYPYDFYNDSYYPDGYFGDTGNTQTITQPSHPAHPTNPGRGRCFTTIKERLVYIKPDGVKYGLHAPPSRVVTSEEGFGAPPLQYIVEEAPFQHGDTVRDYRLQARNVQLVVMQNFLSRADYRNGRATFLDALRPNRILDFNTQGKLLYYLANGDKRQLDVVVESGPGFAPSQGGWREWSFTEVVRFVAHDPLWYDPQIQSLVFSDIDPTFVFPVTFPITFGAFGASTQITYDGTWLSYPTFVVTGPLAGFRIENVSTNKLIQLDYSLPAGYTMTITLHGRKTITRSDGMNLMGYLSPDSDLATFALLPEPEVTDGINSLRVGGSGASGTSQVVIYWYKRYYGI